MKTAEVYKIFRMFNLLWKCPSCEYENNTEVDRADEDMVKDVHGKCDGCNKKFLLETKYMVPKW